MSSVSMHESGTIKGNTTWIVELEIWFVRGGPFDTCVWGGGGGGGYGFSS